MTDRVVLAYSGGLDTSVAIGWIAEQTGAEVIACAVDVGQDGEDLEVIRERALACGAVESEVADARAEFADGGNSTFCGRRSSHMCSISAGGNLAKLAGTIQPMAAASP